MSRNPTNDLIQFITGGSLFGGGIFLLANQVMAALGVGVLNSIRLTFMSTTLWALATYIVMIAAGEAWQGGSPMGLKPAPSDHSATSHATICSCSLARSALVTNRANCGC